MILKRISGQEELGRIRSVAYIEKERDAETTMAKNLAARYNKPYFSINAEGSLETVALGLYEILQTFGRARLRRSARDLDLDRDERE